MDNKLHIPHITVDLSVINPKKYDTELTISRVKVRSS